MTTLEIKSLPAEEKLHLMEVLWEDMRERYDQTPVSQKVIDLLRERRARVERGEAQLLDWDNVKFAIGRG